MSKTRNPRYMVSLDGYELASVPSYSKVEAVKRAKQLYPGQRGRWTATRLDDEMFKNMRGGAELEARMRLERRLERKRAKLKSNPRRPKGDPRNILAGDTIEERQRRLNEWRSAPQSSQRKRNATHIHAQSIDHLDVAKVHNPRLPMLTMRDDGIDGREISWKSVPVLGNEAFQYALGVVEPGGEKAIFRRRANERGTYGGWRYEMSRDHWQRSLAHHKKSNPPSHRLTRATDGIDGVEIPWNEVPYGDSFYQYALGVVRPGGEKALYRRRADAQDTYGGWIWDMSAQNYRRSRSRPKRSNPPSHRLTRATDGIDGVEIPWNEVPYGDSFFQYALGVVRPGGEKALYRRRADAQDTYGGWIWDMSAQNYRRSRSRPKRSNPSAVTELYQSFSGKPARRKNAVTAPTGTPSNLAKLGRLRLIQTTDGRRWKFTGSAAPFLAADHKQKLHVVGGRYRANPASCECGEIARIEYETSKPHLGQETPAIYFHELGEESGERPTLVIDDEGLIRIEGGNYWIEADGIHN